MNARHACWKTTAQLSNLRLLQKHQIKHMKKKSFILRPDKKGFPSTIDIDDPTFRKLRSWLKMKYGALSESIVCKNTVKISPELFGINNYGRKTWSTKVMMDQISKAAEKFETEMSLCDNFGVMPASAWLHFISRLGSYTVAKRHFILHHCMLGSEKRNLASHMFLEEKWGWSSCAGRSNIYEVWDSLKSTDWQASVCAVGEDWKYGKFFAMNGIRPLRVEVWYDNRIWKPKKRLIKR